MSMEKKDIQIYGAGLSGLVSAINLVRNGYNITVYEKEKKIGGSTKCTPSNHMTPANIKKMQEYIGIKIETCFSKLDEFRGYISKKKFLFSTKNLYVVERGRRESSLDNFLYNIALKEGVNFKFLYQLTCDKINDIPKNSIIATGGYSKLVKCLKIPFITFKQFETYKKTDLGNITIAYFGDYSSDYGYLSAKNGTVSAQLSGSINLSRQKLNRFIEIVKETENITLKDWSFIISHFPKKVQLYRNFAGKKFVLAGDISGFLDPFFGFGINGALISGKIASLNFTNKQKALEEFKKFSSYMNKNLLLHTFYWHLPFKNYIRTQIMKYQKNQFRSFKRSIPGFTDKDWLKIVSCEKFNNSKSVQK